jgi:hypothetical protein
MTGDPSLQRCAHVLNLILFSGTFACDLSESPSPDRSYRCFLLAYPPNASSQGPIWFLGRSGRYSLSVTGGLILTDDGHNREATSRNLFTLVSCNFFKIPRSAGSPR